MKVKRCILKQTAKGKEIYAHIFDIKHNLGDVLFNLHTDNSLDIISPNGTTILCEALERDILNSLNRTMA